MAPLEEAAHSEASIPLIRMAAFSVLALVSVQLGRLSKAWECAEAARALVARGDVRQIPQSTLVSMATGAVQAARGRLDEARSELERAVHFRRKAFGISPWPTFEILVALARVLLELGDRAGAAEMAAEAREVLIALPDGTEALQARLKELDARIVGRSREVSLAEPLTERETAVLRLLGSTLSLREIGEELYVSANTVKTHTQAIYRKLGVSTRQDAIESGKRLGILPRDRNRSHSPG